MSDHNINTNNPVTLVICTIVSWTSVIITLQNIDIYLRIICSLIAIVTGIFACINWHWSIKKNKKMAKKDIPF